MALPTYVKELRSPDMKEIFPYFSNLGGIMQVTSQFTPCIQPVSKADNAMEIIGDNPFVQNIIRLETHPIFVFSFVDFRVLPCIPAG